ncbi:MAG: cytochrome b/b6 domain-containing protein [Gammaproteobacteria bacterium]|nr:cytochrome b/b6 domain-containing protein [Gammaproteobacteria bacterium]
MSGSNKSSQYTVARVLHWVGVVIIGFNLLSGWRLGGFELEIKQVLLMIHSGVGTTIFFLMLFRWWWRKSRNLYNPPRWWKKPTMVLQWVFYPLVVLQVVIGVTVAAFIDYEVLGFGFIPYSSIAADSERLQELFLQLHAINAWLLIALVVVHGIDRGRFAFIEDAPAVNAQEPANN